jgi:hypothetical protein
MTDLPNPRNKRLAAKQDQSPDTLTVEQTNQTRPRQALLESALDAKSEFDKNRLAYKADEVHEYFRAKIQRKTPAAISLKKY